MNRKIIIIREPACSPPRLSEGPRPGVAFLLFFPRSSIGGVAYVIVVNSSATWAATFRLREYKRIAGYFRVSIIHRTLTCTTGSLTCVHGLSCPCVYTRGMGTTPTANQRKIFDSEKLEVFLVLLTGFEPSLHLWISSPTL